jgi:predicted nucleotidyltransferase
MSGASARLRALARDVSEAYLVHSRPDAILLVGSAGRGDADRYSDLDLLLYYEEATSESALAASRDQLAVERARVTPYPDEEGSFGERYDLDGIQCQLAHVTVAQFEHEIDQLVVDLELNEVLPKIMTGLMEGLPLHGDALIAGWRRRAAYTEPLQRAMIERHWSFFPWWHFQARLGARDTTIWRYDVLVQSAYNLVGVLAALNRLYFSRFEFKRSGDFLGRLELAPPDFQRRLHSLFELPERDATVQLESLVAETRELVAERFPELDLSLEWGGNPTPPGSREAPWG